MKRKFLVATMAICMAGAAVMPAVGCKTEESAQALKTSEFVELAASSLHSYAKTHSEYDTFEDTSFTVTSYLKTEEERTARYIPEGETEEKTVTLVDVSVDNRTLKMDVKRIDGELFIEMETVRTTWNVNYDRGENDAWIPVYNREEIIQNLSFGVENGVYYETGMESYRYGETELGAAEVEKYYRTFDGVEDYREMLGTMIITFNEAYAREMYLVFGSGLDFQTFNNFSKYYKDGDLAIVDVDFASVSMGRSTSSAVATGKMQYAYGKNGFSHGSINYLGETADMRTEKTYQIKLDSSSKLAPRANALNGYALKEDMDYYDYFGYVYSDF